MDKKPEGDMESSPREQQVVQLPGLELALWFLRAAHEDQAWQNPLSICVNCVDEHSVCIVG